MRRPISRRLRRRQRRAVLGHVCPTCREPWALTAVRGDSGFLVVCRYCTYQRPVSLPKQSGPPAAEMLDD